MMILVVNRIVVLGIILLRNSILDVGLTTYLLKTSGDKAPQRI
jgi:hypothetical protein